MKFKNTELVWLVVAFLLGLCASQIYAGNLVEGQLGLQGGALPPSSVMCSSLGFCGSDPPGYAGQDPVSQQQGKAQCAVLCG